MEHFLPVAKNIMFHESEQFVIAGILWGLEEGVEPRFQSFEFSRPRKDQADGQTDVDDNFAGPR